MKKAICTYENSWIHSIKKGDIVDVTEGCDGFYKTIINNEVAFLLKSSFKLLEPEYEQVDTVVESVLSKYKKRSALGLDKYGTTMDRDDLSVLEWLNHAQEEAMDLTLYLEKIMNKIKEKDETKK